MAKVLLQPRSHYSTAYIGASCLLALPAACMAENQITAFIAINPLYISAMLVLMLSVITIVLYRYRKQLHYLKKQYENLSDSHEALLEKKYQWHTQEAELIAQNEQLDRRLTARTETVNKINHDLTETLERNQQLEFLNSSLKTALNHNHALVLIIDKHYCIRLCSQGFLDFTGLHLADVQDKPLRQLEKHLCLPEMASERFSLNKEGWLDTQLKCRDTANTLHVLSARISLTWSEQKEINHYVIIIDKQDKSEPA